MLLFQNIGHMVPKLLLPLIYVQLMYGTGEAPEKYFAQYLDIPYTN